MHIITSQSAGVLHVPACNHDRPPKAGIYFYVHALCTVQLALLSVLIATPEAALSLVQIIYCAGGIEDIKNNLVHYAYSEVSSLTKSFFTSVS